MLDFHFTPLGAFDGLLRGALPACCLARIVVLGYRQMLWMAAIRRRVANGNRRGPQGRKQRYGGTNELSADTSAFPCVPCGKKSTDRCVPHDPCMVPFNRSTLTFLPARPPCCKLAIAGPEWARLNLLPHPLRPERPSHLVTNGKLA